VKFIKESIDLMLLSPNERKKRKVNLLMSKKVRTRNPSQCHTHHQKMLEKYSDPHGIIEQHWDLLAD
jgi:hypothetical protein